MQTLQFTTPAGPLTTIVDDQQVVRAAGFTADPGQLSTRLGWDQAPPLHTISDSPVSAAIHHWIDGDLTALDQVDLQQQGTNFQHQVWAALRQIPVGQTATYADLAAAVERPSATRAVGSACGRNLIAPFIPCHRAVRRDGTLGGYAYGLAVKEWLLAHESG